jgi:hypothetical protein
MRLEQRPILDQVPLFVPQDCHSTPALPIVVPQYDSMAPVACASEPANDTDDYPQPSRLRIPLVLIGACLVAFAGGLLGSQWSSVEKVAQAAIQPLTQPIAIPASVQATVAQASLAKQSSVDSTSPVVVVPIELVGKKVANSPEKSREVSDQARSSSRQEKEQKSADPKPSSATDQQEKAADNSLSVDSQPDPEPALAPFDTSSASSALGALVPSAAACLQQGDPSTTVHVTVTFAPSGRATVALVDGPPYAGTTVGGCIARIFRSARVSPFEGSSTTVHKSFHVP